MFQPFFRTLRFERSLNPLSSVWLVILAACGGGGGGGGGGGSVGGTGPTVASPNRAQSDTTNSSPQDHPDWVVVAGIAHALPTIPQQSAPTILLYENHPTAKPVSGRFFEADAFLPFGMADNDLFRMNDNGLIFFRQVPDFESPADTGNDGGIARDGHYHLRVLQMTDDGQPILVPQTIRIVNLPQEKPSKTNLPSLYGFQKHGEAPTPDPSLTDNQAIRDVQERFPTAALKKLIWGPYWKMPETGPLVLTYSLQITASLVGDKVTDERMQETRNLLDWVLLQFEMVTNIRFVEIDRSAGPHIGISITSEGSLNLHGSTLGNANAPGRTVAVNIYTSAGPWVALHEVGHMLGLKHPFSSGLRFRRKQSQNEGPPEGGGIELAL